MSNVSLGRLGRLCLVGCGNMGGAMLHRWVEAGLPPASVTVVDPGAPQVPAGTPVVSSIADAGAIDTLILAVKPQQLGDLHLAGITPRLAISILAGVEEATLLQKVAAGTLVRAMPNLPVTIGKGVVALFSSGSGTVRDDTTALMTPLGLVEWIDDESQFDTVTALAGCGPGFVFRFAEALAAAGVVLGLHPAQAERLALATLEGAAAMAMRSNDRPATLADRVASPGGSTREGLNVLDHDAALARLMTATLTAAAARNRDMAAEARSLAAG